MSLFRTGASPVGAAGMARIRRDRRAVFDAVTHAPQALRALVRADEIWLVVLAAALGLAAGLIVVLMSETAQLMHRLLYGLASGEFLSSQIHVHPWRALLVPSLGGLVLGVSGLTLARWWPRRTIDPIEANALYGGRMSLGDSLVVVCQTVWSNGVGASVGLEAGYAQIGSALASRVGRAFRVRRTDLRLLVGCGAAAAIAAAFNAPLTGAFYAFELVIGTYSLATLTPVVVAAIWPRSRSMRVLTAGGIRLRHPPADRDGDPIDYVPILALGMICALFGIALMRGVTLTEDRCSAAAGVPPLGCGPAIGRPGRWPDSRWLSPSSALGRALRRSPRAIDAPYALRHDGAAFGAEGPGLGHLASAPGSAAGCSSRPCCSARWSASCSQARWRLVTIVQTAAGGGVRAGRHEQPSRSRWWAGRLRWRSWHSRAPEVAAADGGRCWQPAVISAPLRCGGRSAIQLRDMALPSARRGRSAVPWISAGCAT